MIGIFTRPRDRNTRLRARLCAALKNGDAARVRVLVAKLSRRYRNKYLWMWEPDRVALQKYYDKYMKK